MTNGDRVQVYAGTTGLPPGLHTIYVNVTATIGEQMVAETIRVTSSSPGGGRLLVPLP